MLKTFTAVADALEWCITHEGVEHEFHYLDDLEMLGPLNYTECDETLYTLHKIATELGILVAADK